METLCEPKPKKYCRLQRKPALPIVFKKDGSITKFESHFNGFSTTISDPVSMYSVTSMGFFGKANFSRSLPQPDRPKTEILRERLFKNRKKLSEKFTDNKNIKKVVVVPDSDDELDYFKNLRPEYRIDGSGVKETVWLSLEETFYLADAIGCLNVRYGDDNLNSARMWNIFCEVEPLFCVNYVVYHYYRSKNWVVKPGIKFGGDYLLYKEGPPFYHASYVVVIDNSINGSKTLENVSILRLIRLCETAGKELLICRINFPQKAKIDYSNMNAVEIEEIFTKRWISSLERKND